MKPGNQLTLGLGLAPRPYDGGVAPLVGPRLHELIVAMRQSGHAVYRESRRQHRVRLRGAPYAILVTVHELRRLAHALIGRRPDPAAVMPRRPKIIVPAGRSGGSPLPGATLPEEPGLFPPLLPASAIRPMPPASVNR